MIRINLIKSTQKEETKKAAITFSPDEMTKQLLFLAMIVVTIGVAAYFWFDIQAKKDGLNLDIRNATVERDRLKVVKDLVDKMDAEKEKLGHRLEVLSDLKNNLRTPVYNLFFVYLAQQDNYKVLLKKISQVQTNMFEIQGEAAPEDLNRFSDTLRNDRIVSGLNMKKQAGQSFTIEVIFVPISKLVDDGQGVSEDVSEEDNANGSEDEGGIS